MKKLIAIGGLPATGKSTIMGALINGWPGGNALNEEHGAPKKVYESVEPRKLVSAMYCKEYDYYILGKYEHGEKFPGTDRLSMAVQPEAEKFLQETTSNVVFEGDRIFTSSFLEKAVELADAGELDLKIMLITANHDIVSKRHVDRQDTQSEKFLKGRDTKYDNIRSSFILMPYITVFENNNTPDFAKIVGFLQSELETK